MSIIIFTPQDMAEHIAQQVQAKRLELNFSQKTLSERSGVSFGVIKKFERTGQISLASLLKLGLALGALDGFSELFKLKQPEQFASLDALLMTKKRQRGRQ